MAGTILTTNISKRIFNVILNENELSIFDKENNNPVTDKNIIAAVTDEITFWQLNKHSICFIVVYAVKHDHMKSVVPMHVHHFRRLKQQAEKKRKYIIFPISFNEVRVMSSLCVCEKCQYTYLIELKIPVENIPPASHDA